MTHTTNTLSSQERLNETGKENSSELIKTEQIGETPFVRVTTEGEQFIALGPYKIAETNLDKVAKNLVKTDWQTMIAVISAITDQVKYNGAIKEADKI